MARAGRMKMPLPTMAPMLMARTEGRPRSRSNSFAIDPSGKRRNVAWGRATDGSRGSWGGRDGAQPDFHDGHEERCTHRSGQRHRPCVSLELSAPVTGTQDHQERHHLQPARHHEEAHEELCRNRQGLEPAHRPDGAEARADVAQHHQRAGKGLVQGKVDPHPVGVHGDKAGAADHQEEIR